MIRPILIYPRLPLKTACVYPETDEAVLTYIAQNKTLFAELIQDLADTLEAIPGGVGLASNQIGNPDEAAAVLDPTKREGYEGTKKRFHALYPTIIETSEPKKVKEGCLSLPDYFETIERFEKVKVKYFTLDSTAPIIEEAEGFLAQIWQHEVDHLNGKVFVEHLSPMRRQMAEKKMSKTRKRIQDFEWTPETHRFFGAKGEK